MKPEEENSAEDLIELGLTACKQNKPRKALKYFKQTIAAHPNNLRAYIEAGKILKSLGRFQQAKARFEQVLQKNPTFIGALIELGNIAYLEGELEQALEKFQEVIKYHPNHLWAHVQAGRILRELKRFTEAEKMADLGLTKCQKETDSLNLLREKGFALVAQLKLEEASKALQKFVSIGGDVGIFFYAALTLANQKMFREAIDFLESNVSFLQEYSQSYINIQRMINAIYFGQNVYNNDLKKYKINEPKYSWFELSNQKPIIELKLSEFNLKKINYSKLCLFISQPDNVNFNQGFDSLDNLLKAEQDILYNGGMFKQPIYRKNEHQLFSIPRACCFASESNEMLVFSLNGYFIDNLIPLFYPLKVSNHCLSLKIMKKLPLGFFLPSTYSNNYYHFVCECLPTLYFYKKLHLDCPIIWYTEINNSQKKILEILGIPESKIILGEDAQGIEFEIGIAPKGMNNLDLTQVNFYREITQKLLAQEKIAVNKYDKVYISRKNSLGKQIQRTLINEDKIEELLSSLGFFVCYMENYTFEEQVAIMNGCQVVVSPHGAGLTNILFCNPGVTVIELVLDKYPIPLFYNLSVLCGHQYYPILGHLEQIIPTQKSQDFRWKIDLEKLLKLLEKILSF